MGFGRELPWLLLVALCAATAIGVAAYALGSGTISGFQISVALVALAFSQLILFARFATRNAKIEVDLRRIAHESAKMMRETREERHVAADLAAQVSVMRSETQNFTNSIVAGLNDLRQSHAHLAESIRVINSRPPEPVRRSAPSPQMASWQSSMQQAGAYDPPLPPAPDMPQPVSRIDGSTAYSDSLALSLEPVIDLFSGQTAHYRLHYAMTTETDGDVSQEVVSHHADQNNLRHSLDVHLVRESVRLLQRLRRRDPKLSLFMPIGAKTLSERDALHQIVTLRSSVPEGAGLVIDIPHAVLASLPESALEGLAYLARSSVDLSLNNASVSGLDLGSLDKLNVRFVGVSSASVGSEPKMSKGIAGFVQAARALRIQVIVTNVASAQQATQLMRIARFASGPAFAPPRRVRKEATNGNGTYSSQDEYSAAAE